MDVLSSQATIAGYKAVLLASTHLPKFFPMLTTAAGSIPPAKVLIIGAGVAGLMAIATARRLGGVVEAFDTRPAVKEEVKSLGAKFVEVEGAADASKAGGYAVEQTEEYKQKQSELIQKHALASDVIVTTAQIPGRKAPLLISTETLNNMKKGSVIVDLASSSGGNCEMTKDNATIDYNGITIIGNSNLPSTMPYDASIEVISKVPSILHTPLMSGANAIHGVVIVGAVIVMGLADSNDYLSLVLGFIAVILGTLNVVGGFVVTDRMLEMFKKKPKS
ncbi:unnamed protein product [Rotaria sp. Silwood1]|nr:unnamed protein product [Rotaria sp. Silwood1]